MTDTFSGMNTGLESPARRFFTVAPDDATDLPYVSRALNVAQSGIVRITGADGDVADIFVGAGLAFPVRVRRVWQTGTTATGITALF